MPLFGKSHKSPQELVKTLRDSLLALQADKDGRKSGKVLWLLKKITYDSSNHIREDVDDLRD